MCSGQLAGCWWAGTLAQTLLREYAAGSSCLRLAQGEVLGTPEQTAGASKPGDSASEVLSGTAVVPSDDLSLGLESGSGS